MAVFGLGRQSRCLAPIIADTDHTRYVAATSTPHTSNTLYILDFNDDTDEITHVVFEHTDEVVGVSTCPAKWDLVVTVGRKSSPTTLPPAHTTTIYKIPNIDTDDQGRLRPVAQTPATSTITSPSKDGNGSVGGELQKMAVVEPSRLEDYITQVIWDPSCDMTKLAALTHQSRLHVYGLSSGTMAPKIMQTIDMPTTSTQLDTAQATIYPKTVFPIVGAWNPHTDPHITVGHHRSLSVFDIRSSSSSPCIAIPHAHAQQILTVDYNPNKMYQIASGGMDSRVRIWDLRSIRDSAGVLSSSSNGSGCVKEISDHSHWIWCVSFNKSHDQLLLTSGSDCTVNLQSVVSVSSARVLETSTFSSGSGSGKRYRMSNDDDADDEENDDDDGNGDTDMYQSKIVDGLVSSYDHHEDSVYSVQWSPSDPWIFASLSGDGRVVVNSVPRDHKYKIIL